MNESPKPAGLDAADIEAVLFAARVIRDSNLDATVLILDGLLKVFPENAGANLMRGAAWQKQGDLVKAIECFERAVAAKPDCPLANSNLGRCLFEKGRMEEAEHYLRESQRLDPRDYTVVKNLGLCFLKLEKYREGFDQLNIADAHDRDNPTILNGLAYALCGLADEAKARERASVSEPPAGIAAQMNQSAAVLESLRLYREAETLARRAIEKSAGNSNDLQRGRFHLNLGWALAGQGRFKEAEVELTRARELSNRLSEIHYYTSVVYEEISRLLKDAGKETDKDKAKKYSAMAQESANTAHEKACIGVLNERIATRAYLRVWKLREGHEMTKEEARAQEQQLFHYGRRREEYTKYQKGEPSMYHVFFKVDPAMERPPTSTDCLSPPARKDALSDMEETVHAISELQKRLERQLRERQAAHDAPAVA